MHNIQFVEYQIYETLELLHNVCYTTHVCSLYASIPASLPAKLASLPTHNY